MFIKDFSSLSCYLFHSWVVLTKDTTFVQFLWNYSKLESNFSFSTNNWILWCFVWDWHSFWSRREFIFRGRLYLWKLCKRWLIVIDTFFFFWDVKCLKLVEQSSKYCFIILNCLSILNGADNYYLGHVRTAVVIPIDLVFHFPVELKVVSDLLFKLFFRWLTLKW